MVDMIAEIKDLVSTGVCPNLATQAVNDKRARKSQKEDTSMMQSSTLCATQSVFILLAVCACPADRTKKGFRPLATCFTISHTHVFARRRCLLKDEDRPELGIYDSFAVCSRISRNKVWVVKLMEIHEQDESEDWVVFKTANDQQFETFLKVPSRKQLPKAPCRDSMGRAEHVYLISAPVGILTTNNAVHLDIKLGAPVPVYMYTESIVDNISSSVAQTSAFSPDGPLAGCMECGDSEDERDSSMSDECDLLVVRGEQTSGTCEGLYLTCQRKDKGQNDLVVAVQLYWSTAARCSKTSRVAPSSTASSVHGDDDERNSLVEEFEEENDGREAKDDVSVTASSSNRRKCPRSGIMETQALKKPKVSGRDNIARAASLTQRMLEQNEVINSIESCLDSAQNTYYSHYNEGSVLCKLVKFTEVYKTITNIDLRAV